jgi:hypothetical protein
MSLSNLLDPALFYRILRDMGLPPDTKIPLLTFMAKNQVLTTKNHSIKAMTNLLFRKVKI